MDELSLKINEILNSEEGMNQVRTLANSLGLSLPENFNSIATENKNILSAEQNKDGESNVQNNNQFQNERNIFSDSSKPSSINPDMLLNVGKMLSSSERNDKNTALLIALKDHLSEERQRKVDDAIKIMHLVKILPFIKEMGFFGGDKK